MTTPFPAELEALMPKPDIRVDAFGDIKATDRRPFVMGDYFTADQVRQAMLDATERAAKKERNEIHAALRHAGLMLVRTERGLCIVEAITGARAENCAAAIRGDGGQG